MKWAIVVPWHREEERAQFLKEWEQWGKIPRELLMQQDKNREGCGVTKNKGIARAVAEGAEVVVVLDGDCYPAWGECITLNELAERHMAALEPQPVQMFDVVTEPASRGTPYFERSIVMPVAASIGFWINNGDHCAVRQLATANARMDFQQRTIHGRYFALCGMNVAFKPAEWNPWCQFIDVSRFDDIWMGWLWQREAYRRGHCFNLAGPVVQHSRQSNVWKNLRDEALHLERNEVLWREIAMHGSNDYAVLRGLLPV